MEIIGSILTNPENGWIRIEETDSNFTYEGVWGSRSNPAYSGGSQKTQPNTVLNNKIKFKFYGTKIRIISSLYPSYTPKVKITIDGIEEYYTLQGTASNSALAYEKTNLPLGLHYIEIEKITNGGYDPDFIWDAIDIDYNGYIANKDFSIKRLAIKDQTTNEHYSLVDNTLIHMPDNSPKNMILHGIEQGKEIQLDVPFTKHKYFNDKPVASVSGKVFTHDIGKINTLNIKELKESKNIVTTLHETKMTSNTSPSPLVASASNELLGNSGNTLYEAYKAFDGINGTSTDSWIFEGTSGWVKLDFGKKILVTFILIASRNLTSDINSSPKDFILYGSNDDKDWIELCSVTSQKWASNEKRSYNFSNTTQYRYYRLNISSNNGESLYTSVGELQFGAREVK